MNTPSRHLLRSATIPVAQRQEPGSSGTTGMVLGFASWFSRHIALASHIHMVFESESLPCFYLLYARVNQKHTLIEASMNNNSILITNLLEVSL
jgi:hypothetical protein